MTDEMLSALCYYDKGEGKPVLLLHGWGCRAETMEPVAAFLRAKGFRTIAPDFPGHGDTPEPDTAWGVAEYAELTARIIEKLGVAPVDIVAHSFGCRVAITLAAKYPGYVKNLLMTGAAGVLPRRSLKYYVKIYSYKLAKQLAKCGPLDKALGLSKRAKNAGSADYRALSENMKKTFVKVVNEDLTPLLEKVQAPTFLVWGSEDDATPLYMARVMQRRIPDCALEVFQGASHFAFIEELGRFCAIAGAFFGG